MGDVQHLSVREGVAYLTHEGLEQPLAEWADQYVFGTLGRPGTL